MQLEILRGPDSYSPETAGYAPKAKAPGKPSVIEESIPESRGEYAEIYSTKHERILLRVDHITKMDAIRKSFNGDRMHPGQRALTTSDIVNAALDFAFEHRIPFSELQEADGIKELISKSVYRSVLSRWRQFNEQFD